MFQTAQKSTPFKITPEKHSIMHTGGAHFSKNNQNKMQQPTTFIKRKKNVTAVRIVGQKYSSLFHPVD